MSLKCTLKMVKMVNFVLCVFCHIFLKIAPPSEKGRIKENTRIDSTEIKLGWDLEIWKIFIFILYFWIRNALHDSKVRMILKNIIF